MFSWVSRHLGEGWVTGANNKDTGKELLRLILTINKQELDWIGFKGGYVYHLRKGVGLWIFRKYIFICRYSENGDKLFRK